MCGITAFINATEYLTHEKMDACHNKGKHRGPESTKVIYPSKIFDIYMGFHRLAINGLDEISNQPIELEECILICNGEIYNYCDLYKKNCITNATNSDCEIIIHLYKKYGIKQTLSMLDGVFAFVLVDNKKNKCYVARDPYGVRPLFQVEEPCNEYVLYGFSSELKQLCGTYNNIKQFCPGTYIELTNINGKFAKTIDEKYSEINPTTSTNININEVMNEIKNKFTEAVKKRISSCERPIACLLSGGLDSSLVASIVKKHYKGDLETYSIGLHGSEDLKYASVVAKYLDTKHTEIVVSEIEFFNAIPEVIQMIESYDTTTVRASVGNYLLGKYISRNSDAKVIFNGDGSDELMGGYLYMSSAPDAIEFDRECRRLLTDIHKFDVLRSDRCVSGHGLEPRTPFLDRGWVQYYMSLPNDLRHHSGLNKCEKYLIRESFDDGFHLPTEILWRRKEAFSDGVSSQSRSWYKIIEERVSFLKKTEKEYYKELFNNNYGNCSDVIPYYWMPRYIHSLDASARTLPTYLK
jgi:asparagine synthase (glutamine-hydrolysing)